MRVRSRLFGYWLLALASGCGSNPTPPPADDTSGTGTTNSAETSTAPGKDSTSQGTSSSEGSSELTSDATTVTASSDTSSSTQPSSSEATSSSEPTPSSSTDTSTSSGSSTVEAGVPQLLSQTGLYSDIMAETLGPRVKEYQPQFQLWTDGADKRRWVHIPEGSQIDATYMDEWQFPVGTKVWKEFSRDGVRIETRMLEKLPPERASEGFQGWLYMTYVWNDELTEATATVDGVENAKGTDHDVPSQKACGDCHDMRREKPLGVSALQLSHSLPGATIDSLFDDGWLSAKPEAPLVVPGTEEEQQILGYFHANCGHCHREGAPANNRVSTLKLWLSSDKLATVEGTEPYVSLVNTYTESGQGSTFEYRIVPGDPDNSEVMRRLLFRSMGDIAPVQDENGEEIEVPMPPLGTEVIDDPAVERVRNWILSLPTPAE